MVNLQQQQIVKVQVDSPESSFTAIKNQEGKWEAQSGDKKSVLKDEMASALVNSFSPLAGTNFLNDEEKKEFQEAQEKSVVFVYGAQDKVLAEISLVEKESVWWAQVTGRDIYYKISSYVVSDIFLTDDQLFAE